MVEKLLIKDIKILSEGQQVKKAILSKYKSLEEFVEDNCVVKHSTLIRYVKSKKIKSQQFKENLPVLLNMKYIDVFKTVEQQIEEYIEIVYLNIKRYNSVNDENFLEYLKQQCLKYNMNIALAKMYSCIGLNSLYTNNLDISIYYIQKSLRMYQDYNKDIFVTHMQICLMVAYISNKQSKEAYEISLLIEDKFKDEFYIDKLNHKYLLYVYYMNTSTMYLDKLYYNKALKMCHNALKYAQDDSQKSRTWNNIGNIYAAENKYQSAYTSYKMGLSLLDKRENIRRCMFYNNLATMFYKKEDYESGLFYCEKALQLPGDRYHNHRILLKYSTYCEILLLNGDIDRVLELFRGLINIIKEHKINTQLAPIIIKNIGEFSVSNNYSYINSEIKKILIEAMGKWSDRDENNNVFARCVGIIEMIEASNRDDVEDKIVTIQSPKTLK